MSIKVTTTVEGPDWLSFDPDRPCLVTIRTPMGTFSVGPVEGGLTARLECGGELILEPTSSRTVYLSSDQYWRRGGGA